MAVSDPVLLEIELKAGGKVEWAVKHASDYWAPGTGPTKPLLLDPLMGVLQLVSLETVGLTEEDIEAWLGAERAYYNHNFNCRGRMDCEQQSRSDRLELEADALRKHITDAIKAAVKWT
jgi:hypothetical protein